MHLGCCSNSVALSCCQNEDCLPFIVCSYRCQIELALCVLNPGLCVAGSIRIETNIPRQYICIQCKAGRYARGGNADYCEVCPAGSTSPAGSASISACGKPPATHLTRVITTASYHLSAVPPGCYELYEQLNVRYVACSCTQQPETLSMSNRILPVASPAPTACMLLQCKDYCRLRCGWLWGSIEIASRGGRNATTIGERVSHFALTTQGIRTKCVRGVT
jgi:hypothetical protein